MPLVITTGLMVERTGDGEGRSGEVGFGIRCLSAETMDEVDEGGEGLDIVKRSGGDTDHFKVREPAEARADVAAPHVKGQHILNFRRPHLPSAFPDSSKSITGII